MRDVVFFYSSDDEILELSESGERPAFVLDRLNLELKLLVLLIPLDGCLVFPPSHFLESPICRSLVLSNLPFIYEGYVRLIMRESTLSAHLEKERDQYRHLGHVERYKLAYYLSTDYDMRKLPFSIVAKNFLTGKATLDIWEREIRSAAHAAGYPQERIQEFISRIREDEELPFVWELVRTVQGSMDFKKSEERSLDARAAISMSYLKTHRSAGLLVPSSSMVVRDVIVPAVRRCNTYDLLRFQRLLQFAGVFERVAGFGAERILRLKFSTAHVMDEIRQHLGAGLSIERICSDLTARGLIKELQKAVLETPSRSMPRREETEGLGHPDEEPTIVLETEGSTRAEWVRVAVVQLEYEVKLQSVPFSCRLSQEEAEGVRKKLFRALEIAKDEGADIVCFPELSFEKDWLKAVEEQCRDKVIVCGSYYEDGFNVCPVVIDCTTYRQAKIRPSVFESAIAPGKGMRAGHELRVFQTRWGRLAVLVCIDYTSFCYRIYDYKPDIIINPCYDEKILRFQERASVDARDYECFIIQANRAKYGGTCIIGKEHKHRLKRLVNDRFKPDDGITYKLCQATGEMVLVASVNVRRKAPSVAVSVGYEGIIKNIVLVGL